MWGYAMEGGRKEDGIRGDSFDDVDRGRRGAKWALGRWSEGD